MPGYNVKASSPAVLKKTLSGVPCSTTLKADQSCLLKIEFTEATILTEIVVRGQALNLRKRTEGQENVGLFEASIDIATLPKLTHTLSASKGRLHFVSRWTGRGVFEVGETLQINLRSQPMGTGYSLVETRLEVCDIRLSVERTGATLGGQLAALFNNEDALKSTGDVVEVRLNSADHLFVSKFVLQLRSPVFRDELSGSFEEARTHRLSFEDFPDMAVQCFLELLHKDSYDGPALKAEDLVAVYALGDKYDIEFVQSKIREYFYNRELTKGELRSAIDAIRQFRAIGLRSVLTRKVRQLALAGEGDDMFECLCGGSEI